MTTEFMRKSISATLSEIEESQRSLGIVSDPEELSEIRKIVGRIEAKLHKRRITREHRTP